MFSLFQTKEDEVVAIQPQFNRGCFGKIEFSNVWIDFNLLDSDLNEFRKQLRNAVGMLARKKPITNAAIQKHMPELNFILMNPDLNTANAGVISPRVDASGRPFPFVIFSNIHNCRLQRQSAAVPVLLQEFFEQASALQLLDWKNSNLEHLQDSVAALPMVSSDLTRSRLFDGVMDLLKGTDVVSFWQGIPLEDTRVERAKFLVTITSLLKTVIAKSALKTSWGLRLPLPKTDFVLPYVVFYIQLIESHLKDSAWQAQVFWNSANDHQAASFTIFFKAVKASMLCQLMDPTIKDGDIIDVLEEMERCGKPTEQAFMVTGNDKDSLMDALFKWVGFNQL